jgi:hypothetical protein
VPCERDCERGWLRLWRQAFVPVVERQWFSLGFRRVLARPADVEAGEGSGLLRSAPVTPGRSAAGLWYGDGWGCRSLGAGRVRPSDATSSAASPADAHLIGPFCTLASCLGTHSRRHVGVSAALRLLLAVRTRRRARRRCRRPSSHCGGHRQRLRAVPHDVPLRESSPGGSYGTPPAGRWL